MSQVEQHLQSHHEKSFTSPLFQAQYFEMVLPRAARDPSIAADAKNCTACHSPVSYANNRSLATSAGVTDPSLSGVTCDLCHTIVGYEGDTPQNGNFIVSPGATSTARSGRAAATTASTTSFRRRARSAPSATRR